MKVWISNRSRVYHTNDNCPHISDRHRQVEKVCLNGTRGRCSWCDGTVDHNGKKGNKA